MRRVEIWANGQLVKSYPFSTVDRASKFAQTFNTRISFYSVFDLEINDTNTSVRALLSY